MSQAIAKGGPSIGVIGAGAWGTALAQSLASLAPGVIPAEGGVPLEINGGIVGGLGISGVRSFQDGQIAAAGVAALTEE